jgi:hypothetical protein
MLVKGNTKLGAAIHSFNLPVLSTCPGKSAVCILLCYATRRRFKNGNVKASHSRNLDVVESGKFIEEMFEEIEKKKPKVVRIHAAGDFFSLEYVKMWTELVKAFPNVVFYAYTRSWNVPRLYKSLLVLAKLPNFDMWFSTDKAMGKPPKVKGVRTCYLAQDDDDKPRFKVDLVFREKRHTKIKKYGRYNSRVCPVEQGIKRKIPITCSSCKICFSEAKEVVDAQLV